MTREISRSALAEALLTRNPPILLEALPRKYYDIGHLPTARLLPPDEVDELGPKLIADRKAAIVVYCANATCQNSHDAARRLAELGYSDVAVYSGGKQDWIEAGLRLEK